VIYIPKRITKKLTKRKINKIHVESCPICFKDTLNIILYKNKSDFIKRRANDEHICSNPLCPKFNKKINKGEVYVANKKKKYHIICNLFMRSLISCTNPNCNLGYYIIDINRLDEKIDIYGKLMDSIKLERVKYAVRQRMEKGKEK